MATIRKRGDHWQALVKRNGVRTSKTFRTKGEARDWAAQTERDISDRSLGKIPNKTLADLLIRYRDTVAIHKKGVDKETIRINALLRDPLAEVALKRLDSTHIAEWRDRRLETVSGSSVNRDWNLISAAINISIKEWGWLYINPMSAVRRPPENKPRTRIPTENEISALETVCGFIGVSGRVRLAMLFAIETAARAGEIAKLTWDDINGRVAHVIDAKNGEDRFIPLSRKAIDVLDQAKAIRGATVFGLSSRQISSNFARATRKAGIEGLTFHDLRRLGTTRLSTKFDVLELSKVTGHKDLRLLRDVYYSFDAESAADKL